MFVLCRGMVFISFMPASSPEVPLMMENRFFWGTDSDISTSIGEDLLGLAKCALAASSSTISLALCCSLLACVALLPSCISCCTSVYLSVASGILPLVSAEELVLLPVCISVVLHAHVKIFDSSSLFWTGTYLVLWADGVV